MRAAVLHPRRPAGGPGATVPGGRAPGGAAERDGTVFGAVLRRCDADPSRDLAQPRAGGAAADRRLAAAAARFEGGAVRAAARGEAPAGGNGGEERDARYRGAAGE